MPNEHQRASKMQSKTNNSEKLATPDTQDTRRRQTKQKHNTTNISSEKWHMEYFLLLVLVLFVCWFVCLFFC